MNLTETKEFADALFSTIAQAVVSFQDGAQVSDILAFVDEADLWKKGIQGFAKNFRAEAVQATPSEIDEIFNIQFRRLTDAGVNEKLAYAVVNAFKGIFATIGLAAANKAPLAIPVKRRKEIA